MNQLDPTLPASSWRVESRVETFGEIGDPQLIGLRPCKLSLHQVRRGRSLRPDPRSFVPGKTLQAGSVHEQCDRVVTYPGPATNRQPSKDPRSSVGSIGDDVDLSDEVDEPRVEDGAGCRGPSAPCVVPDSETSRA